jgi:hypothetical protein
MTLLPKEIFNQHVAVLGKTGAGKSSALRFCVEQLLDADQPVCIVDPKGDWWGLKSSKSGKEAGYPVVIFGGDHADVPLNAHAGNHVAELVATGNRPCIIDLGGWMVSDRTKFFIDFASTLFRQSRGRRLLVIDEVHNFAPQGKVLDPAAGKMLHWCNRLASEGRGKGLTILSASQRPQKVHKDFLTCAETLIAMRVIHNLDRGAIKDWIDGCDDASRGKEVLGTLAQLERGEAWVWSPEIKFGPNRLKFPMFRTYDSFSPQAHTAAKLKGWAEVDLEEVKSKLSAVVQEAKANDPAELKRQIAELKKQLGAKQVPPKPIDSASPSQVAFAKSIRDWKRNIEPHMQRIERSLEELRKAIKIVNYHLVVNAEQKPPIILSRHDGANVVDVINRSLSTPRRPQREPSVAGDMKLGGGALRMVQVLADRHPARFTEAQWATMSGLKRTGGTWSTYKSRIVQAGLAALQGDLWQATEDAVAEYGDASRAPTSSEEVLDDWKRKLGGGSARMLDALRSGPLSREDLATAVGIEVTGGTFGTYLSRLRSNGLVDEGSGLIQLAGVLA